MINDNLNLQRKELSEKEMQMKARKEIMELCIQLGNVNIAAWAGEDDEETGASSSMTTVVGEQVSKSVIETRVEAWEEAEQVKFTARSPIASTMKKFSKGLAIMTVPFTLSFPKDASDSDEDEDEDDESMENDEASYMMVDAPGSLPNTNHKEIQTNDSREADGRS